MTPETYAMLQRWLKEGDANQKHHAIQRLSLPDAVGYEPPKKTEVQYPSFVRQAKNFARAAGAVVSAVVHGESISVSQEEQDRRLEICHACLPPEGFWDAAQGRCSKCGCFGTWKTWLASQSCPIGKW